METYKIIRFYSDSNRRARTQKTGLSLAQAQEHCGQDDTSSRTHPKGRNGCTCDWFDGYTEQ